MATVMETANWVTAAPPSESVEICEVLRKLHRRRRMLIKSKNGISNRLAANTANLMGYFTQMEDEEERRKIFSKARRLNEEIIKDYKKRLQIDEDFPHEAMVKDLRKRKDMQKVEDDTITFIVALCISQQ